MSFTVTVHTVHSSYSSQFTQFTVHTVDSWSLDPGTWTSGPGPQPYHFCTVIPLLSVSPGSHIGRQFVIGWPRATPVFARPQLLPER